MQRCKDSLEQGMLDFQFGVPFHKNPYKETGRVETHAIGYHGVHPIGIVRIDIDFGKWWEIGWNLAERNG